MTQKFTKWLTQSQEKLIESPVMNIVKRKCINSKDPHKKHDFYVLESNDWCNIIPVTASGKIVLIEQYRIGIDETTLEIPGGIVDSNDTDLEKTALRELEEETGYCPTAGAKTTYLGWGHPNPAIQNNKCHSFIVGPVEKTKTPQLDPGEIIETVEVTIEELPTLLKDKKISHSLIQNAFLGLVLKSSDFSLLLKEKLNEFKGS